VLIARCCAAAQAYKTPHLLLLDEPTNHLVRDSGSGLHAVCDTIA